jgi:hypothetical protein
MPIRRLVNPPLIVAMLALFVALGGSALAVRAKSRPVVVCGNGSVKAFAAIQLDSFVGAFPAQFSDAARLFNARWSCNGAAVQVRDAGRGVLQLRFPGLSVRSAVVSPLSSNKQGATTWWLADDGTVNILVTTLDGATGAGVGFSIAAM